MCVWTKKRGSMNAVVLMATPCPKSLHGKGEKWIAQHLAGPDDSVKHSQPRSQHALAAWRQERKVGFIVLCVLLNGKKQKARPKGVNLKERWRAKFAMRYRSEESARRAILVWECRDRPPRRSVGKGACVCSCGYDPTPGQGNPWH